MNCLYFGFKIILVVLLPTFCCCTSNTSQKDVAILKSLDEGMVKANKVTSENTKLVLAAIDNKRFEPSTHYKAELWYSKALLVQKYSSDISKYLSNLKSELGKRAADKGEHNKDVVAQFFRNEGNAEILLKELNNYRVQVVHIDSENKKVLNDVLTFPFEYDNIERAKVGNFLDVISNASPVAAHAFLSQLESWVGTTEYTAVKFCYDNIPPYTDYIHVITPLIAQSVKHVKGGQEIEVKVGIGGFISTIDPKVNIGGKEVQRWEEDGMARYKIKASKKVGKHTVPVGVEFTDRDGKRNVYSKNIEYTVIQ